MNKENREKLNFVKVEATGFQDLCNRIAELERENKELRNDKAGYRNSANFYKKEAEQLRQELEHIKGMSMFEFGNTFCSQESLEADGHKLAQSLLGHTMTPNEVAVETFENGHEPYTGDDF